MTANLPCPVEAVSRVPVSAALVAADRVALAASSAAAAGSGTGSGSAAGPGTATAAAAECGTGRYLVAYLVAYQVVDQGAVSAPAPATVAAAVAVGCVGAFAVRVDTDRGSRYAVFSSPARLSARADPAALAAVVLEAGFAALEVVRAAAAAAADLLRRRQRFCSGKRSTTECPTWSDWARAVVEFASVFALAFSWVRGSRQVGRTHVRERGHE